VAPEGVGGGVSCVQMGDVMHWPLARLQIQAPPEHDVVHGTSFLLQSQFNLKPLLSVESTMNDPAGRELTSLLETNCQM